MAQVIRPGVLKSPIKRIAKDPNFASVVLLSGFNGADASTTFVDDSPTPHTLTASGNAQLDTAQAKFGTASLLLDGVDDIVTSPDNADWAFGSGNFTVEAHIRLNVLATDQCIIGQWNATGNQRGWHLLVNSSDRLQWLHTTDGITTKSAGGVPAVAFTTGAWFHVAVVRNGNVFTVFIEGQASSVPLTAADTLFNSTALLRLGAVESAGSLVSDFNGWIDELRVTKGVARYTANFTPPGKAFPRQ